MMVLLAVIFVVVVNFVSAEGSGKENCCERKQLHQQVATWQTSWSVYPTASSEAAEGWSVQARVPMGTEFDMNPNGEGRGKFKVKKKLKKFLLPLLLAYKLKFFTLIPVLIGLLVLLTGATGLAGFFFALFAAVMGLKTGHK